MSDFKDKSGFEFIKLETRKRRSNMKKEKIEGAINDIRPNLQADGGDVELLDISDDGVVRVKLLGACGGCPMAQMTLKMGIERHLKSVVPEIKEVVAV